MLVSCLILLVAVSRSLPISSTPTPGEISTSTPGDTRTTFTRPTENLPASKRVEWFNFSNTHPLFAKVDFDRLDGLYVMSCDTVNFKLELRGGSGQGKVNVRIWNSRQATIYCSGMDDTGEEGDLPYRRIANDEDACVATVYKIEVTSRSVTVKNRDSMIQQWRFRGGTNCRAGPLTHVTTGVPREPEGAVLALGVVYRGATSSSPTRSLEPADPTKPAPRVHFMTQPYEVTTTYSYLRANKSKLKGSDLWRFIWEYEGANQGGEDE